MALERQRDSGRGLEQKRIMYIWWNCSCIAGKNKMLLQENITNKMFSASCNILVCLLCNIIYNFSQFSIQDRGSAGNLHHILFCYNGLSLRLNCWPDLFPMQFQPKDKYKFCLKMKNYFHLDISYQQIIFPFLSDNYVYMQVCTKSICQIQNWSRTKTPHLKQNLPAVWFSFCWCYLQQISFFQAKKEKNFLKSTSSQLPKVWASLSLALSLNRTGKLDIFQMFCLKGGGRRTNNLEKKVRFVCLCHFWNVANTHCHSVPFWVAGFILVFGSS